ncbi:MAG: 50S ribosomal protein L11 methyltransferase [Kouleothrix sp.]|nr:50S ribosomal protein L11 methyltransferase [Kouleothrix sp.]
MTWLELSVDVEPEAVESVSELLSQHGYNGGVVIDQPIIPGADGTDYTFDAGRPATLRTYLPLDQHAEEARQRVEQALWHFGQLRAVGPLTVRSLDEQDWANAWKQHYTIQHIGARTVIVPSWLEYEPRPGEVVLRLDPGMAFGTGLHPTTQLCLALIEQYVRPGSAALDLGCGSGILAIAAAQLGASVLALDTDPIAVEATRENVARNGVAAQVVVAEGSLGGAELGHWLYGTQNAERRTQNALDDIQRSALSVQHFDLIVANIIARVLAALAQDLAAALRPAGVLIASGIIAEREAEVAEAFAAAGLDPVERRQEGDWVALVYRRGEQEL